MLNIIMFARLQALLSQVSQNLLAKQFGLYAGFGLLSALVPLLSIPILTANLTPAEYGLYGLSFAMIQLISQFLWLGLPHFIGHSFFAVTQQKLARYIFTCILVSASAAIALIPVIFYLSGWLSSKTEIGAAWWFVILLAAFMQSLWLYIGSIWQFKGMADKIGIWRTGQNIVTYGVGIALIIVCSLSWFSMLVAITFVNVSVALYALYWLHKHSYLALHWPSRQDIKKILIFSLPLLPFGLGNIMLLSSDRFIITSLLGADMTGIYTVAWQITAGLFLLSTALERAWRPWLLKELNAKIPNGDLIKKILCILTLGTVAISAAYAVFAPFLLRFMAPENYHSGTSLIFPLVIGVMFFTLYKILAAFLLQAEKTLTLGLLMLISAGVNIGLNLTWIPQYGLIGAAWATAVSYALIALFISANCWRQYR